MSRSALIVILSIIAICGFLLRVNEAFSSSALAHPDEIFQTLEPAHRLAYGYGIITWEWRDGVRSWLFPALLAGTMRITDWMGRGSIGYLVGTRILLCVFSMAVVWFGFVWAKRAGGMEAGLISAAACATWYEVVGFAPRAMTEVVAAHVFLIGLYLGTYSEWLSEKRRLFWAAVACGIALSLRIQLAPAVVFACIFFCQSRWRKRVPVVVFGMLLGIAAFGLADLFTWGRPFQSSYLYFWENVVEGKSLLYGREPWYWYLIEQMQHLGPVLILALVGVRRSAFLGWIALIILGTHSAVGHKEARFLYPLLPIVMVLSALGFVEIAKQLNSLFRMSPTQKSVILSGLFCFLLTSSLFASNFPYWLKDSGAMTVFSHLSTNRNLCGVGLYGVPWFNSGGYTYLHQDVPIVLVSEPDVFERETSTFNALVASEHLSILSNAFGLSGCWNGVCLYERRGSCTAPDGYEINKQLQQTGN